MSELREIWTDTKYEWNNGGKTSIIIVVSLILSSFVIGLAIAFWVASLPKDEAFRTVVILLLVSILFSRRR